MRAMTARLAAEEKWPRTRDPSAAAAPAPKAALERFEREVDPNDELPADELACRAHSTVTDPAVVAYIRAVQAAKRSIHTAIDAAADVARPGLPTWQVIDLAATTLGIEVAHARAEALRRRLQLRPSSENPIDPRRTTAT